MCKKPHKHADLIKAWADGAEIEFYIENDNLWAKVETPGWRQETKYRIKPEPKPDMIKYGYAHPHVRGIVLTERQFSCDNVKYTFDGENSYILKSVEIIHGKEV